MGDGMGVEEAEGEVEVERELKGEVGLLHLEADTTEGVEVGKKGENDVPIAEIGWRGETDLGLTVGIGMRGRGREDLTAEKGGGGMRNYNGRSKGKEKRKGEENGRERMK